MTIENEAFIDLEQMLHERVDKLWRAKWKDLQKQLNKLANEGKWEEASKIAQNVNFDDIVDETKGLARTLAEAALFLGASRVDEPENASFFGAPDESMVATGVEQWSIVLVRNASIALQTTAELALAELQTKAEEERMNLIIKAETLGKVGRQGTQYSRAAAALMISRMSTAGFMLEASARGIKQYRVSEVMDGATCPICAEMHNKHFPVSDGLALSTTIMQATDPESLKAVSPFPSQSAANVKAISQMGQRQLVGAGLNLPPYHPNCRGIATLEEKNREVSLLGGFAGAGSSTEAALQTADLTPEQLAVRMFGDFDELDEALLGTILGAGAGALVFGDNEGEGQ